MEQQPIPSNPEAEQAVLGSILIDGESVHSVRTELEAANFFRQENQWIYDACLSLCSRGEAIDQITIAKELNAKGKLEESGGASYLSHLIANTPTSLHIEHYGRIVKSAAIQRMAISLGSQVAAIGYSETDPVKLVEDAERRFLALQKTVSMPHLIVPTDLAKMGDERYAALRHGHESAVQTGFHELDFQTGGAFPGEYWIMGGRPGIGKTTVLLGIAESIATTGNALFCSLEMQWGHILDRLIAERLNTSPQKIRHGEYSEELYGRIVYKLGEVSELNLYFFGQGSTGDTAGVTTTMLHSIANHMKLSYGLSAVIVDYIGLFADDYGKSSYERISHVSRRLKNIAQSLEVPLICAAQLSRAVEQRAELRPVLHDFRESGRIEEDADVVLFLYRDDYYPNLKSEETVGKAEIIIAKQRQGESNISVPLTWDRARRCYA